MFDKAPAGFENNQVNKKNLKKLKDKQVKAEEWNAKKLTLSNARIKYLGLKVRKDLRDVGNYTIRGPRHDR